MSQSRLTHPGHQPDNETVILIRTNYMDPDLASFIGALVAATGYEVFLVADERNGVVEPGPNAQKISITAESCRALDLYIADDSMWRCGDYAVYIAQNHLPQFRYFWMLEPDVRINFEDLAEFFTFFDSKKEVDFLSCRYGASNPSWWWFRSMAPYSSKIYNCMFPVTRLSRKAIEFLLPRRAELKQLHVDHLAQQSGQSARVWPNDEAFVATELSNNAFVCRDLNHFGRVFHTGDSFSFASPISLKRLEKVKKDSLVYHPVLAGSRYLTKVRNLFNTNRYDGLPSSRFKEGYGLNTIDQLRDECGEDIAINFQREVELAIAAAEVPAGQFPTDTYRCDGTVISSVIGGKMINFFVNNQADYIQGFHLRGRFYEDIELALISEHFKEGDFFLDVGAHVGNHTVYVAVFLRPSGIMAVEPNKDLASVLQTNVSINGLWSKVDCTKSGIALSASPGEGIVVYDRSNTGVGRVVPISAENPAVPATCSIVRGDDLLEDTRVDFIKLDVGGSMELEVLKGLKITLRRDRPKLFVHVPDAQQVEIFQLLKEEGYSIGRSYRRHNDGVNLIAVPMP